MLRDRAVALSGVTRELGDAPPDAWFGEERACLVGAGAVGVMAGIWR